MNKRISILLIGIVTIMITSCTPTPGRQYAGLKSNLEVERMFRTGEMLPQFKYYFNGPESVPRALLALDRKYILKSQFWHEIESNKQLQEWISEFRRIDGEFDDIEYVKVDYRGLDILAADSHRIGMIYTRYHWVVAWKGEGSEIYVLQPEPSGTQKTRFHRF